MRCVNEKMCAYHALGQRPHFFMLREFYPLTLSPSVNNLSPCPTDRALGERENVDINTLTIGQAIGQAKEAIETGKQIEAALGGKTATSSAPCRSDSTSEGLNIVILDRGFVYVGDVEISGDWVIITNAKNVRRWGTSQGLGELAAKGPQPETKLDMGGTIKAPRRALIGLLKCEASKWTK